MRRWEKAHGLIFGTVVLLLMGSVGFGVYIWQQVSNSKPVEKTQVAVLGENFSDLKRPVESEKFKFLSSRNWQLSRDLSHVPNKFVYSSQQNGIVEYELTVYFTKVPPKTAVDYIYPVSVKNGKFELRTSSSKCDVGLPKNIVDTTDTIPKDYDGVQFVCDISGVQEIYAIGISGGSYDVPMYNSKGQLLTVGLFFTNHTSQYKPEVFSEIIKNFSLK